MPHAITKTCKQRQDTEPVVIDKDSPLLLLIVLYCWIYVVIYEWFIGLLEALRDTDVITYICANRRVLIGLPEETPEAIRKLRPPTWAQLKAEDDAAAAAAELKRGPPSSPRKTPAARFRSALKRTFSIPARRPSLETPPRMTKARRNTLPSQLPSHVFHEPFMPMEPPASPVSPAGWLTIPGTPIPLSLDPLSSSEPSDSPASSTPRRSLKNPLSPLRGAFPLQLTRHGSQDNAVKAGPVEEDVAASSTVRGPTAPPLLIIQGINASAPALHSPASMPTFASVPTILPGSFPSPARRLFAQRPRFASAAAKLGNISTLSMLRPSTNDSGKTLLPPKALPLGRRLLIHRTRAFAVRVG
ncbi:hypothetical protein K488DRAFT_86131 [Vararia minispora EC-137]|uniref:Uncharacterized protein n=1 Tax=Vararia minispora EC-137 TaxID=1314806 RepID=A0ACB8QKA4_9AGAM|nr:hypothetical protein K488DRAFT_86131 [Vararia minispora EC-137]